MITLDEARENIGKLVFYNPVHEPRCEENGIITGVNGVYVFVAYKINGEMPTGHIDEDHLEILREQGRLKSIATPPNCLQLAQL